MGNTDNQNEVMDNVIDIQLQNPKKNFRINGDNSKIIELNPSDVNIVVRLKDTYKRLNTLATRAGALLADKQDASDEETITRVSEGLETLDTEMRELIDKLFDSPVSGVLADGMNMYSPVNGEFWFEHCIEVLSNLYTNNFNAEFKKMQENIRKQTRKITGKS